MYDTVVLATDGSASTDRAMTVGLDLVDRFDASVYALYVINVDEIDAAPEAVRDDLREGLKRRGRDALETIDDRTDRELATAIREGRPASQICAYADEIDADVIVTGTRGRHGEHAFLLGSVAEAVVRQSRVPVLSLRQLEAEERRKDSPAVPT